MCWWYTKTTKFSEILTDWLSFQLVSDKLHVLNHGVLIEEVLYVGLVHPGFYVTDPERFGADLPRLLVCQSMVRTTVLVCHFFFCFYFLIVFL